MNRLSEDCSRPSRSPSRGAGARRAQRLRDRARMGRARRGARRRQGEGLHGDQRAAGSAPRRGEAEPHRARAQRRSRRRHRRRARDRLAAARARSRPAIRRSSPASPAISRRRRYVTLLEKPTRLDRAEGDVHRGGQSAHPDRSAQHRCASPGRWPRGSPNSTRQTPRIYQARYKAFAERWNAAIANWEKQAAPLRGMPILVQHKAFTYLDRVARAERGRGARAQARRRADDRPSDRGAGDAAAAAGRRW